MAETPTASHQLQQLLADEWEVRVQTQPLLATRWGDHRFDDKLPRVAAADMEQRAFRERLHTIDRDLLDAGAQLNYDIFGRYLALARPALTVVAIFTFIASWNDFLGPLIYLSSHDKFTIAALGLATFKGMYATQWHYLMAASTIMVVPIIVLFFLAQRYFVQGIVMTGLK